MNALNNVINLKLCKNSVEPNNRLVWCPQLSKVQLLFISKIKWVLRRSNLLFTPVFARFRCKNDNNEAKILFYGLEPEHCKHKEKVHSAYLTCAHTSDPESTPFTFSITYKTMNSFVMVTNKVSDVKLLVPLLIRLCQLTCLSSMKS